MTRLTKETRARIEAMKDTAWLRLRIAREAALFTQAGIARELGITRGRWSQYEKGQRLLNWQIGAQVAVLCDVDCNYLFTGQLDGLDRQVRARLRKATEGLKAEEPRLADGQHLWRAPPLGHGG